MGKQKYKHGREGCSVLAQALKTGEDQSAEESTATTTFLLQSWLAIMESYFNNVGPLLSLFTQKQSLNCVK